MKYRKYLKALSTGQESIFRTGSLLILCFHKEWEKSPDSFESTIKNQRENRFLQCRKSSSIPTIYQELWMLNYLSHKRSFLSLNDCGLLQLLARRGRLGKWTPARVKTPFSLAASSRFLFGTKAGNSWNGEYLNILLHFALVVQSSPSVY